MNTLFENHMDLFTKNERPKIEDWIFTGDNARPYYARFEYQFKPPVTVYKKIYDALDVEVREDNRTGDNILYVQVILLNSKEIGWGEIQFDQTIQFKLNEFMEKGIKTIIDLLEWNDYVNLPSNLIEDIEKRIRAVAPGALKDR